MSTVLYEQAGKIVTITINRPDAMNAIDPETQDALVQAWTRFRDDDGAWVAILMSQASACSMPPARQWPLIAAIMGFQISSPRVMPPRPNPWWAGRGAPFAKETGIIFLRSAPAEKLLSPAPVRMATQAPSSSRKRVHAPTRAS